MSGYDIKKFIEQTINYFWRESFGQIYPALKQLASEGLVSAEEEASTDGPNRIVYSITQAGRRDLQAWLREPHESEVPRVELLLKLFFGPQVSPDVNLEHIARERDQVAESLATLEEIAAWLQRERGSTLGFPYYMLTVRQGILSYEAKLAWCDEAERTIRALIAADESDDRRRR
jgi:DNA-binding PadR family transcriptional regulator